MANVSGDALADYVEGCAKLDQAGGLEAIELNVSCPNVERGGIIMAQAGITGHLTIGERAFVGPKSGVHHDVPAGTRVLGSPQRPERTWHKMMASLVHLPGLLPRVRGIGRRLGTRGEGAKGLRVRRNNGGPVRARLARGHEIAHTMVDPPDRKAATVTLASRKPSGDDELERLCDEIAVELLLPYGLFSRALGEERAQVRLESWQQCPRQ